MVLIRCQLILRDLYFYPPLLEAHFFDMVGRKIRILDKFYRFADDEDAVEGWVRGTELERQGEDPEVRVLVSLASPDSLETTEGADSVEVWAKDLVEAE